MLHSNPSAVVFAQKTMNYAAAKAAYFEALRAALPILTSAASNEEERSPDVDKFAAALAVAREEQEKTADSQTLALFARFPHDALSQPATEFNYLLTADS